MSILTFILRFLLIFFGAAAFANGVFLCVYSNLNLGVFLTIALGVFLAACGVFLKKIAAAIIGGGAARAVCVAVAAVAVAELALTGFIFAFGHAGLRRLQRGRRYRSRRRSSGRQSVETSEDAS